ncbi:MAG TPA: archease [Patescibacteria group bacterium]|nr:archease [Patescibacteria group bacterium]
MRERGHDTIDHTADMGIRGWGAGIPEAFEEAARAMFELAAELDGLAADREVSVSCEGTDAEELLVEFLNTLLTRADLEDLVFVRVSIDRLGKDGGSWRLGARVMGAPRERAAGRLLTEVKAATYYGASVRMSGEGLWEARCVVDL